MTGAGLQLGVGAFTGQSLVAGPGSGCEILDVLEHAVLAEELGFDSLWLSEHHFSPDGYTGALFPLLGALTARTNRLVLGTRVLLAPLHPALLLAEDAAQLAVLSGGRFLMGLGLGYRDQEFQSLRIDKADRVARLVEVVEVCRKAWTGEAFDHDGPTMASKRIVCRPAPPIPPRIWIGGRAAPALRRAVALADGYVAPVAGHDQTLAAVADLDAITPRDRPRMPVMTGAFVLLSRTQDEAEVLDRGLEQVLDRYAGWVENEPAIRSGATDDVGVGVVRGTPAQVSEILARRVSALRGREHHLQMRVAYPGMTREQIESHMRLLASEVMPMLRDVAAG